jgi:hypothetical protein
MSFYATHPRAGTAHRSTITDEKVLEDLGQLRVPEGHHRGSFPGAGGTDHSLLILPENFETLTEDLFVSCK